MAFLKSLNDVIILILSGIVAIVPIVALKTVIDLEILI